MINAFFEDLSALPRVETITLGGSRAGTCFAEASACNTALPPFVGRIVRFFLPIFGKTFKISTKIFSYIPKDPS